MVQIDPSQRTIVETASRTKSQVRRQARRRSKRFTSEGVSLSASSDIRARPQILADSPTQAQALRLRSEKGNS